MKKTIAFVLALCLLLALTACGGGDSGRDRDGGKEDRSEPFGTVSRPGGKDKSEPSEDPARPDDAQPDSDSGEEGDEPVPAVDVVFGNEPNNLFQKADAPCFGDENAYFISGDDEIVSVPLSGGEARTVGTIGGLSNLSYAPCCLNWYRGSVYYVVVWDSENYDSRYIEIRSMDVSTGAETVVLTCTDNDYNACGSMMIIGDSLFYECYDVQNKSTAVNVFDLTDARQNQVIKRTVRSAVVPTVIAADSRYVYLLIDGAGIYRTPWSGLYDSEPTCEKVVEDDLLLNTVIFTDDGFYAVADRGGSRDFVFYRFDASAPGWPSETVAEGISDGSPDSESADPAGSLIYYADNWMLGDAYAAYQAGSVYCARSADFTQSAASGELEVPSRNDLHAGAWEGTLYLIVEGAEGPTLHTLTADGTYT